MENESIESKHPNSILKNAGDWRNAARLRLRFGLRSLLILVTFTAIVTWYLWSPTPLAKTNRVLDFLASQDVGGDTQLRSRLEYAWGTGFEQFWGASETGPVSPHQLDHLFEKFLIGNDKFDDAGHKFYQFTHDGDGISCFLVWQRPDTQAPPVLVAMTISGEISVVLKSFWNLPFVLAHDVRVFDDKVQRLADVKFRSSSPQDQWDQTYNQERLVAMKEYRAAVTKEFGNLPPLEELLADTEALNAELQEWLEKARAAAPPTPRKKRRRWRKRKK